MRKYFLVSGCAGFIGFHLSLYFLKQKKTVIGIDNINDYYSTKIKLSRLKILKDFKNFKFHKVDISEQKKLYKILHKYKKKIICIFHLAAQAGVRYSITNPDTYIKSNLDGFFNILNYAKINSIKYFFYASSSSVYGNNVGRLNLKMDTSKPLSLYAATKKANEVLAYSYSQMFNITTVGLRFFTVYGPYGRPDMSIFKFTEAAIKNKTLNLFNNGNHYRDFTYVDDVTALIDSIYKNKKNLKKYNIFNISNGNEVKITYVISLIKKYLDIRSLNLNKMPLQIGDIHSTLSDTSYTDKFTKIKKRIPIEIGISNFINWYINYFKIK